MKRALLLLVLLGLGGGLYYYLMSPPKFDGKYAGVHEGIWKFTREKSLKVKLEIAAGLELSAALRQEDAGLSEDEKKTEAEAIQFLTDTSNKAKDFEAKLTPEDIEAITSANPASLFRRVHMFRTSNFHLKCSEAEYLAVRQKLGFPDVLLKGLQIGALVSLYEDEFRPGYYQKIVDLLKADDRFGDYRDLANGYYALMLEPAMRMRKEDRDSRIAEYEGNLAKAGVPGAQFHEYVLSHAAESLACLGGINIEFVHRVQEDDTRTRGQFLLDQIRQFIRAKGKAPEDMQDLPLNKADPLYGKVTDGWGYTYDLAKQGKVLVLSSQGRDGHSPIKIGEVPL